MNLNVNSGWMRFRSNKRSSRHANVPSKPGTTKQVAGNLAMTCHCLLTMQVIACLLKMSSGTRHPSTGTCWLPTGTRQWVPGCGYLLASNRYPPMGAGLRVPVGFQQVPANGCRVRVRVSGFEVKMLVTPVPTSASQSQVLPDFL
ncbi:hypothetical protein PCANC_26036 [Puccinia coronata f. sp. avenae]|uniref:Uncharacterized protein n=1 Tax=Puccinia coronata f. sp. avenae TaxID=200324 RepID=A0A2N5S4T7_9BASI|nr:hypothetical protein PCANC_26036 [Puccinia coronata f. sp. avenae]